MCLFSFFEGILELGFIGGWGVLHWAMWVGRVRVLRFLDLFGPGVLFLWWDLLVFLLKGGSCFAKGWGMTSIWCGIFFICCCFGGLPYTPGLLGEILLPFAGLHTTLSSSSG